MTSNVCSNYTDYLREYEKLDLYEIPYVGILAWICCVFGTFSNGTLIVVLWR